MSTPIPDGITSDICEDSLITCPTTWAKYQDRDGDTWWETDYSHDGDRVMLPAPGDCPLMLRRDAERFYGPLIPTA